MSVTYTATLSAREETVLYLAELLRAERVRRGTRAATRCLGCYRQAVLVLRWFLDNTRLAQLARDNAIGKSTAYDYLHEGIDVLAAQRPDLHTALQAAQQAGHSHINLDGTLIRTDRISIPGPTPGVDLWWSGKHSHHGGNVQVLSTPDGWPLWTSEVRPGREHDVSCLRVHEGLLAAIREWTGQPDQHALADLGYEGEPDVFTLPVKKAKGTKLTADQKMHNWLQAYARARAEQANALLKMTFKALRRISLSPDRIGDIVAGALVLLQQEHQRTT